MSCAICGKPSAGGDYIGRLGVCSPCYNLWQRAKRLEQTEAMLVKMDEQLEGDGRVPELRETIKRLEQQVCDLREQLDSERDELLYAYRDTIDRQHRRIRELEEQLRDRDDAALERSERDE